MGKSRQLNIAIRSAICTLHSEGKSERIIAAQLRLPKTTVHDTITRFQNTGSYESKKRSGRPKVTTKAEDKYIVLLNKRNRKKTGPEICAELNSTRTNAVSLTTVKTRLRNAGLFG
ncbi:hypothetical protein WH47_04097 [Habropoda laboriosa]|uniref:Paired domain-containing protein n=1 Tax=Habropoda laboriosa TaxID=597456 RepID=A0A0L7QXW6_9HYME|nr:hypothetical protein WH47_04097 [Habropoda laboriosa]